jgi:hypothetical protein
MKTASDFWKSKTTWGGILGVIGTVGMALGGHLEPVTAFERTYGILMAVFFRDAVRKNGM